MTPVSPRAQEILDDIERSALERRARLASGLDGPLAGARLLRTAEGTHPRGATRIDAPAPAAAAAAPAPPIRAAPPAPAPAPLNAVPAVSAPIAPAHGLPAGLVLPATAGAAAAAFAPTVSAPAATPAPSVVRPVSPVAPPVLAPPPDLQRLLRLVDQVVDQTEQTQARLAALDGAVESLRGRLAADGVLPAPASGTPAAPHPPVVTEPEPEPRDAPAVAPEVYVPQPLPIPAPYEPPHHDDPSPFAVDSVPAQAPVPPALAPAAPARSASQPVSDSARLVAIEMAVAGYTRSEVGDRLFNEYGLADPAEILDDVFGQGSDGTSRMPWGTI